MLCARKFCNAWIDATPARKCAKAIVKMLLLCIPAPLFFAGYAVAIKVICMQNKSLGLRKIALYYSIIFITVKKAAAKLGGSKSLV